MKHFVGWESGRRSYFAAWLVLAAAAVYQTRTVGYAPDWLVVVVWGR